MYLTITSSASEGASDLGYLLHKHPDRAQSFGVSFGVAHVFYPEASDDPLHRRAAPRGRPVGLVRRGGRGRRGLLARPVRERPPVRRLVACSRSRSAGCSGPRWPARCDARPELVGRPLAARRSRCPRSRAAAARARSASCSSRSAGRSTRRPMPLDDDVSAWGASRYVDLRLTGTMRLARRALPPLRAAAGARRREALLGQSTTRSTS